MAAKRKRGFIKVSSVKRGKEHCIFCEKPKTGHLVSEFELEPVRGLALTVCKSCRENRVKRLRTVFQESV